MARAGDTERLEFMLSEPKNDVIKTRYRSKRTQIMETESGVMAPETRKFIDEDVVPLDLVIEILRRLPSKSLARFLLVSKSWATIIRSPYFIRSFPFQRFLDIDLQPPILLALENLDDQSSRQTWKFFSSSSASEGVSYLSLTTCSDITSPYSQYDYVDKFPRYVNGLVSLGCGREKIICNPSTGKSITLPKVKSRKTTIQSFLGFDPVDGQHKVLCMSEITHLRLHAPCCDYQVFTLGGAHKSWKMIECNILHRPKTNGVCINGVVYYGALTGHDMTEWCLARFHVRTEKFDQVVQFLGDHCPPPPPSLLSNLELYLISYKDKVALAIKNNTSWSYELWVLEDAEKHEWSKVCISFIHRLKSPLMWYTLRIGGDSSHTGEIVFASHHLRDWYVVYYDHKKDSIRINKIGEDSSKEDNRFSVIIPFFNYVESVMLL